MADRLMLIAGAVIVGAVVGMLGGGFVAGMLLPVGIVLIAHGVSR